MSSTEAPREVVITMEDESSEGLLVTPAGTNLYRLEESSFFGELNYHDTIETEIRTDGGLQFRRLATPSGLKTASWILPRAVFESPLISALLARVMSVGGNWE